MNGRGMLLAFVLPWDVEGARYDPPIEEFQMSRRADITLLAEVLVTIAIAFGPTLLALAEVARAA